MLTLPTTPPALPETAKATAERGGYAFWADPVNIERLKVLAAENKTARQIAAAMGHGLTRNAVIGAARRRGIPLTRLPNGAAVRGAKVPPAPRPKVGANLVAYNIKVKFAKDKHRPSVRVPEPAPSEAPATPLAASLEALQPNDCRWPYGPFLAPAQGFCGRPKAEAGSYCPAHAKAAVRPPEPGKPKYTPATLERSIRRYAESGTVRNEAA